ncbi:MAG: hypothetical protein N0E58_04790 [Candidatus Thiodiazotropha endolucinida]|uniref:Uncharacterized protein n=1 Tax=Candidatus Thiodiazotropha taylori TaxID=2792791 RepID=A0A9E4TSA5_9GAMM|nr:hypothetical protein [Candidatus Thiodiazotropha taylori]MCW4235567.1 hypothetical protein [Candidatus Thiodiazotropha endolucinida]
MVTKDIQILTELIAHKYKSLDEPDYSFVNKAIASKPYSSLIRVFKSIYVIEDITDINDDVSFRYLLSNSNNKWIIELSMLGLYAVLLRAQNSGKLKLVDADNALSEEKEIISLLRKHQFEILMQYILEQHVVLNLFNTDTENVCIYQALFSDTDILPWKA